MPNDSSSVPSRRQFLGAAAGTAATVATAGCLSSLVGSSSGMTQIEPEEPSEPREGSPGEFYYFLEEHDIEVDELLRDDNDLYLTYRTGAETVEESNEEITIVYEIYKQALIQRGSPIEYLYAEIANPFDEQALGWGIDTQWIHEHDDAEGNESSSVDAENGTAVNDTAGNDTAGNVTSDGGVDADYFTLWNKILNTKVYEEDLEDDEESEDNETDTNESEPEVGDDRSDLEDEENETESVDGGSEPEANESDDN